MLSLLAAGLRASGLRRRRFEHKVGKGLEVWRFGVQVLTCEAFLVLSALVPYFERYILVSWKLEKVQICIFKGKPLSRRKS